MNSKRQLLFALLILLAQFSLAQNATELSYSDIDSLLQLYESNQQYDKGIQISMYASKKSGIQDSLCGEYLEWTAYFYELSNQKDKAVEYYNKTLDVFEKAIGKSSARYATTLNFFGIFQQAMGSYAKALPLYTEAKDIREKVLGKAHPDFASSLNNLALLYENMGNYEQALLLHMEAKNINEKVLGKAHPGFATSLNNLAYLYQSMGNYEQALPLYIQAKDIEENVLGKDHPNFAQLLNNLASVHKSMGNYDKALPLYLEAKNIFEKVLGKEHRNFALSLNNLASLHKSIGNDDQALLLYEEAKNINEKVLGKAHPSFAASLNNLAALHESRGNYGKALQFYMEAKSLFEKVLGKEHPNFAKSLNNIASLHHSMEDYEQALQFYTEAKDIREKVLGEEHPDFVQSLHNLASLHKSMGNYKEAWELIGQAMNNMSRKNLQHTFDQNWMDNLKAVDFPSNLHIEKMVTSLSFAYQMLKKDSTSIQPISKQINITDLALFLLNQQRNQTSNEKDKLRLLAQSNGWLQRSLKVFNTKEHTAKAFNLSDQNKSVLLLQATKSEAAYRLGELPDSLVWQDKKMLKKQSQLQAKLLEKRLESEKDNLRNALNQVNQNIDDFVKMIEQKYPKYHKLKYQQVDAKVEDIQALLDENTVLLEYVIGDSAVHIFLVDKKEVQWHQSSVSNKRLKNKIKGLHQALSNYKLLMKDNDKAYRNYTTKAHWFYQQLIEPVLKDKQDIKNLIIVSDGELGHLPFETFLVEKAPQSVIDYHELHYLVNDFNISYNYSATLWKENKEVPKQNNNGQILAMAANYDLKLDSSMMDVRLPTDQWIRDYLSPLPAAREEVEILQEKYEGFFAFDELASEKMVKERAPNYAILHFATHGVLDAKRPVLSSLAMSEDNDSTESNFWQAHEISKIQLNADLVVLSACKTGFGEFEKGNGIASLARAFMYAGAPAMIVSLWQVNDYTTSEIMKNLYENLANGMMKDEALRQAKLQYMKSVEGILAHPIFWSPFIMMGKTDPVYIQKKSNAMVWGIGIGVLALLGIGGLAYRKKAA